MSGFDPEIIQDFLTESGELLEELDADLVTLEDSSGDPDLLNKVFRALHTIKGSASFLALTNLVEIAHVAEDALNAARKGEAVIDRRFMDLLLEAVDVLKIQFDELTRGDELTKADEELVAGLTAIADGGSETGAEGGSAQSVAEPTAAAQGGDAALSIPENKEILLEFMIDDLDATLEALGVAITEIRTNGVDEENSHSITDATEGLARTAEFFEIDSMVRLVGAIAEFATNADDLSDVALAEALPRFEGINWLLSELGVGLRERKVRSWPIDTLLGRFLYLITEGEPSEGSELPTDADGMAALRHDGVIGGKAEAVEPSVSGGTETETQSTPDDQIAAPLPEVDNQAAASSDDQAPEKRSEKSGGKPVIEQTIRVEVGRLESLLNLVGELVLQKNRISALSRQISVNDHVCSELIEAVSQSSGDLDRVTGDIQSAVMRTRLQPLDKIFGKYPRLIRDLARKTGKNIRLAIVGGDTEVDKSVIDELGDPLVHLLRNSADHGIETPEERAQTSKDEMGVITLSAAHEGSHVTIRIQDDGKGLPREKIGAKAVERGLVTQEELELLSDREVYRFILSAGLSTADQVSDLSGRGVGMDVVRSNIENLKGTIDVDAEPGKGTTITIKIPLTVAIMPAMMVGVAQELYAVPLSNIVEIVRPTAEQMSTINGRQVLRIRDTVLPLVRVSELFDVPETDPDQERFAVIVELNEQRAGLIVTELIGQQEIVVKPLDEGLACGGAVSGATVRDDGGVSLIVDVERMIEAVQHLAAMPA